MSKTQKILLLLLIVSVFGIGVGYIFRYPEVVNLYSWCTTIYENGEQCISKYTYTLGKPLYGGLPFVALSLLILMFVPFAVGKWKRFALWFVPLSVVLIALTPVFGESFSPVPPRETLTIWLGWLYLTISLILITTSIYHHKKHRGT